MSDCSTTSSSPGSSGASGAALVDVVQPFDRVQRLLQLIPGADQLGNRLHDALNEHGEGHQAADRQLSLEDERRAVEQHCDRAGEFTIWLASPDAMP